MATGVKKELGGGGVEREAAHRNCQSGREGLGTFSDTQRTPPPPIHKLNPRSLGGTGDQQSPWHQPPTATQKCKGWSLAFSQPGSVKKSADLERTDSPIPTPKQTLPEASYH